MIEKIRNFFDQSVRVFVLSRYDGFARFFAKLLEYFVQALIEQVSGVRVFRPVSLSRFNKSVQIVEHHAEAGFRFPRLVERTFRLLKGVVKTGLRTGMTSWAIGCNENCECVAIAIDDNVGYPLRVTRCLALVPQTGTRPRPETGLFCLDSLFEACGVHVS